MDKRIHKTDKKVILYPGLVKRLIEKGMDALKAKDGAAALEFFLSAEEHEPDHPQVLFGKMLSLVELGRLHEAVEHTSELLKEGIGDYYDNLQVHISLLVQLGQYQEVVDILDAVLSENKVPAQYAESFYQLLHFSRQMAGDQEWLAQQETEPEGVPEDILHMLDSRSPELQMQAILQLKKLPDVEATKALADFLQKPEQDLALSSMALLALQEKGYDQPIHISKVEREAVVVPAQLVEPFESSFGKALLKQLDEELGQESPQLLEFARQLSSAHLFALFPFLPEPEDAELWTAVFHYCACERIGGEEELKHIEGRYAVSGSTLAEKVAEVNQLERLVYQADPFYTRNENR
ncbi:hypothetical protein M3202_13365 [Alkalihalobacillus oceani]|uniref:Tetratricopeptide repeat protein n=1 Tax=Halalkalibacter oceani TaxID=1653776 RepID=A0A9X2IPQ5_9BACI|nr:hypothetical protein [Halalkalibacter oceani]MCM3715071.1 hypothetical protein [Halalkalibacter oceani]